MPSIDQPALDDDVTARLFELSVQRVRGTACAPLCLLGVIALAAYLWVSAPVPAVVLVAVGLVTTWQSIRQAVPGSLRWVAAARRLLTEEPWRETPATVLDARGTVLVLPDGDHVRVHGLPAPAREVAVRAGRVWIVGPDRAGWCAVRVGGLHTPWPARRVSTRNAAPATPSTELIVTAWGRHLVGRARGDLWFTVAGTAVVTGVAVPTGVPWLAAIAAVCGVGSVALALRGLRRATQLRDAGSWRRADAEVPSWTTRANGHGDGTIALRFPGGDRATAHLENVPLDLFATAWHEETLWVAGNATGGAVVGFLDYPLAAFARLTPNDQEFLTTS